MAGEPPNQRRFAWRSIGEALRCDIDDKEVGKTVRQSWLRMRSRGRLKCLKERIRRNRDCGSAGEGQVTRKGHADRFPETMRDA